MIEQMGKNKAKLIVNIGSGNNRKRKTKVVTYKGKKDLQNQYDEFEAECKRLPLADMTLLRLIKKYIEKRKAFGVKATTIRGYNFCYERIKEYFTTEAARKVTTYDLDQFITYLIGKELSSKTIGNTISLISSAYNDAIKTGILEHNPCTNVTRPKTTRKEITVFDDESVYAFMKALNEERLDYKVGYELALVCGLRRSEILGLKPEDIDFDAGTVTISRTRHDVDGDEVIQDTKTLSSYRTLAIPTFLLDHIGQLTDLHESYDFQTSEYLIQNEFGEALHPSSFSRRIINIEEANNLPHLSLHGLRHTFASMLNHNHVDIARISKELGHSSINITLNTYTHVFGDATTSSKGIADAMNKMFTSTPVQVVETKTENSATFLPPSEMKITAEC